MATVKFVECFLDDLALRRHLPAIPGGQVAGVHLKRDRLRAYCGRSVNSAGALTGKRVRLLPIRARHLV
jgi:hypothetical protein